MRRAQITNTTLSGAALQALGRVIVEFNLVEFALAAGIQSTCSATSEIAKILVSELPVRAKVDIFFSILRHLHAEEKTIENFEALRIRVLHAEQQRNQLLHSYWSTPDGTVATRSKPTAKAKRGFIVSHETLTAAEIDSKASEFHRLAEDIVSLLV